MAKVGAIVSLSLAIVSGCAQYDSSDTVDEKKIPLVTIKSESLPAMQVATEQLPAQTALAAPRSLSPDDVRRLQMRLRGVGFDPGPIDGVAGDKTRIALSRFQSCCDQVQGLLDGSGAVAQFNKSASRQDALTMQRQLLDAGFNYPPAVGDLRSRTRALLAQLQIGCPATQEFIAFLERSDGGVARTAVAAQIPERPSATPSLASPSRVEAAKQLAEPVAARPQEDIRILQLRLRDAGFDPGPFDGVMGRKTKLALQQMRSTQRGGKARNALRAGIAG